MQVGHSIIIKDKVKTLSESICSKLVPVVSGCVINNFKVCKTRR